MGLDEMKDCPLCGDLLTTTIETDGVIDKVKSVKSECFKCGVNIKQSIDVPYDVNCPKCGTTMQRRWSGTNMTLVDRSYKLCYACECGCEVEMEVRI
jgi:lysyl-tRNA synthetase class I